MEQHGNGTRQERRQATTVAIQRAALRLYAERGYNATTTEQIAAAAGVAVRTFFRHFPEGKDGVLLIEASRQMDAIEEALRRRPPQESALTAIRAALRDAEETLVATGDEEYDEVVAASVVNQVAAAHPELLARLLGEQQLGAERLVEMVALRMAVDPATDVRPRMLVHSVQAARVAAWMTWMNDQQLSLGDLFEQAFEVVAAGLSNTTARQPAPAG